MQTNTEKNDYNVENTIIIEEEEEYRCERCSKKISYEDILLYDLMCEDCYNDVANEIKEIQEMQEEIQRIESQIELTEREIENNIGY